MIKNDMLERKKIRHKFPINCKVLCCYNGKSINAGAVIDYVYKDFLDAEMNINKRWVIKTDDFNGMSWYNPDFLIRNDDANGK